MKNLLEINQLTIKVDHKILLHDVSFKAGQGRITAIVGGSGSGKTTIASAIMRLLSPPLEVIGGQVIFETKNLSLPTPEQMRQVRGAQIAMIFQEP